MNVYPYSIVHFHSPTLVDNVSLGPLSTACINVVHSIFSTALMLLYDPQFWYVAPSPLNLIFFCFFTNFSINSEVLKIPLSVWYSLITTPWLWYSCFKNTLYRVYRPSIDLKNKQITLLDIYVTYRASIRFKDQSIQVYQHFTISHHSTGRKSQ